MTVMQVCVFLIHFLTKVLYMNENIFMNAIVCDNFRGIYSIELTEHEKIT